MKEATGAKEPGARRIVVVLGMHRSGTSALAGMLQQLGVWMGEDLSPGDDWNAKGYFEDRALVALNERMLAALGRRWESLAPVAPPALSSPESLAGFMDEACTLLERQFGSHAVLAIKDPRLCHLLPFWQRAFARCGLDDRYVLALRSPEAVCRSLWRREGFGWPRSAWLWTGHMMAAVEAAQHRPSMLIDFDELLRDPPAVARRAASFCALQPVSPESEALVRAFIAAELPTPAAGLPAPAALPGLPTRAFSVLRRASQGGSTAASLARSDDWLALAAEWNAMAARLEFADELAATDISMPRLQERLARTEAGLADAQRLAFERLGEVASLSTRIEATDIALAEAQQMAVDRLRQIEALHAHVPAPVPVPAPASVEIPVPSDAPPALTHNVDLLLHRDARIFSYGWGFFPGRAIRRLVLHLQFHDGSATEVDASYGRLREDLRTAFPHVSDAGHSGFLVMGSYNRPVAQCWLRWELDDGTVIETPFELPAEPAPAARPTADRIDLRALLAQGRAQVRSAAAVSWHKARRAATHYLDGHPWPSGDGELAALAQQLRGRPLAVVIDHDMGGGANIYRTRYVAQRRALGDTVVLLSFNLASLQYFVEVFDDQPSSLSQPSQPPRRIPVDSPSWLLPLTKSADLRYVLYNCAVSFSEPFAAVDAMVALKERRGAGAGAAVVEVAVHDYFSICPTAFLIDSDGAFCGVPDTGRCERCLPAHRDGFVSMSGVKDLPLWRERWGRLLAAADRVSLFSESSFRLLRRAYPRLSTDRWVVEPHALHTPQRPLSVAGGERLHIGVVGAIGAHKGAQIVSALASELARRRPANAALTVIGTLDAKVPEGTVQITGAYEPGQLAALISESGANVFFFPSIMAETFSFVAHELVAMDLPFACFDYGAPADLARTYSKGLVIDSLDPRVVLERLEAFWESTYSTTAA